MSTVSLLISLMEQTLRLWNTKEARKYQEELISLRESWYEEYNKPESEISDNAIDSIELKLRILTESVIEASGAKNS